MSGAGCVEGVTKPGGDGSGDRLGFIRCSIWDGNGTEKARDSRWLGGETWSNGFCSMLSRLVGVVKSDSSDSSPCPFLPAPVLHRLVLNFSNPVFDSVSVSCSEGTESASEELREA